jgi:LEA14-like dessication related protein
MNKLRSGIPALATLCLLTACASTGGLVSTPGVSLRNVEITDIDFTSQTFLLGFDVTNPNPFPLPISTVSYAVELEGYRFASGSTAGGFTVPSSGDAEFAISVELDLMKTAPQLLFIIRDSVRRDIPYTLRGKFGLDIPLIEPVRFETSGAIRMQSVSRQALKIP